MKFSIGDPVYVKSNNEEGVIDEFIGKDMASVRVNGKSYYAYLDDLDHPYLRWFLKTKSKAKIKTPHIDQINTEKKTVRTAQLEPGVYLLFLPVYKMDGFEDIVEKVKIYLLNEKNLQFNFGYHCRIKQGSIFSLESVLLPMQQFYLHDMAFEKMANNPVFHTRFVDHLDPKLDNEFSYQMKARKLFEYLDKIKFANEAFFHLQLFHELKVKARSEIIVGQDRTVPKSRLSESSGHFDFSKALKSSNSEIDLHIEQLVPNSGKLKAGEILEIQMRACQQAIDLAYATHQDMLIIIHGIGRGVLKTQINLLLNQTKGIKKYVNEYDGRFGYGATKVFFKK